MPPLIVIDDHSTPSIQNSRRSLLYCIDVLSIAYMLSCIFTLVLICGIVAFAPIFEDVADLAKPEVLLGLKRAFMHFLTTSNCFPSFEVVNSTITCRI